jgi:hypothetical protein
MLSRWQMQTPWQSPPHCHKPKLPQTHIIAHNLWQPQEQQWQGPGQQQCVLRVRSGSKDHQVNSKEVLRFYALPQRLCASQLATKSVTPPCCWRVGDCQSASRGAWSCPATAATTAQQAQGCSRQQNHTATQCTISAASRKTSQAREGWPRPWTQQAAAAAVKLC